MSYRRAVFMTAGCAAALLLLRVAMLPRIAVWATEERLLSFPERLLIAVAEGAYFLIVPLLAVAFIAWLLGRRQRLPA